MFLTINIQNEPINNNYFVEKKKVDYVRFTFSINICDYIYYNSI